MQTTTPAVGTIVRSEVIPGARHWSLELARGYALRLTDLEGGANCAALFYSARNALERYNMADTLKAQHTAFLTRGHCLYSDMGRILVSIASDTLGWHDAFCGVGDAALTARAVDMTGGYYEASDQAQRVLAKIDSAVQNAMSNSANPQDFEEILANLTVESVSLVYDEGILSFDLDAGGGRKLSVAVTPEPTGGRCRIARYRLTGGELWTGEGKSLNLFD